MRSLQNPLILNGETNSGTDFPYVTSAITACTLSLGKKPMLYSRKVIKFMTDSTCQVVTFKDDEREEICSKPAVLEVGIPDEDGKIFSIFACKECGDKLDAHEPLFFAVGEDRYLIQLEGEPEDVATT